MPAWLSFLSNLEFGISTVYWICLLLGATLAVVSIVFGEVLDLAFDTDGGPFSGPVVAAFIVVFGGVGLLLTSYSDMGGLAIAVSAFISSTMVSTVIYFAFAKFILASQGGTTYDPSSMAGQIAEVITGIPGDGTGEITFDHTSGRISGPARSLSGAEIANGALVKIEQRVGGTYIVAPMGSDGEVLKDEGAAQGGSSV